MTTKRQRAPRESALATLRAEREGLEQLEAAMAETPAANNLAARFEQAVAAVAACRGRVVVTGMGKSGHVGRKIAATFASTGTPAHFVHPAEASHGDLGMISTDDVVLALSWSGEAKELADIIVYTRRFKVTLIAVTANSEGALGREADIPLVLPKAREACPNGQAPTTSTVMQMAIGDALAMALLERHGFSAEDFRIFHPGGKLGAQLLTVEMLMHRGEALPLSSEDSVLADAIPLMSEKGFGMLIAVDAAGALAGIVTDGDLRRHMSAALPGRRLSEIMSRTPRTVSGNALATEALETLNALKITKLVVVDEKRRPIGLLDIQDVLRQGVA
ncbi:MAG: KpsF/GutQ family sugar-phosphate isomerase [Beijerinckiaceae bacterium]